MYKTAVLPAWDDNYIFIVHNDQEAVLIDPTCAKIVNNYLADNQLTPVAILNTHHHPDHIGGNRELVKKYELPVYCSEYDQNRVPGASNLVNPGDDIKLLGLSFDVIDLTGHTLGLVGYYCDEIAGLFSGDCIFSLGCGYLFEGSPEQMQESLRKIAELPPQTKIYCSHEYTLSNAEFQLSVDSREGLDEMIREIKDLRAKGEFSVPTSVAFEKQWNIFLRWDDLKLRSENQIDELNNAQFFAHFRQQKNLFK